MPANVALDRVDRFGTARCAVGESPLWSGAERAWYWVDIEGRRIHRHGADEAPSDVAAPLGERPGCIALHAAGGLLCAAGASIVRWPVDGAAPLAVVEHADANMRFNDGRTDRAGRFWVSSMLMDMVRGAPLGRLYRLRPGEATPTAVLDGLIVANGLAFSPDGRTMYLSDSHASVRAIWAFDLDAEGQPSNRRLFADLHAEPRAHGGRPDGAAVDVDGCYWTCANDGGRVLRYTPDGRLDRVLEVPVAKPSMCAFGGARLDEMLITSIRPAGGAPESLAGATFICRPGVQGLAETPFAAAAMRTAA